MGLDVSWVDRLYTHFLGRDLAYTTGGVLFVSEVGRARNGDLGFLPKELSVELIAFLLISYLVGLTLSELTSMIRIRKFYIMEKPVHFCEKDPKQDLVIYQKLAKTHRESLTQLERTEVLMHVGASLGPASSWAAVATVIIWGLREFGQIGPNFSRSPQSYPSYWVWTVFLLLFGISMIVYQREMRRRLKVQMEGLAEVVSIEANKTP